MKIDSGDLNQKIQIMQITRVPDGALGTVPSESVYWDTFAAAIPHRSRVVTEAEQLDLQDGYKFIVRYRTDKSVKSDMYVRYRGGLLKIISNPIDYVPKETIIFTAVWQNRPVGSE